MSEPTVTCPTCGATTIVLFHVRGFPPDVAKRKLAKRCGHPAEQMQYRAGIDPQLARRLEHGS